MLNLSSKAPGVSLTEGPIKGFPAYKLRLPYGDALVQNATPIVKAVSAEEGFTAVFVFRQQRHTLGTLLSINSPGRLTPWFQVYIYFIYFNIKYSILFNINYFMCYKKSPKFKYDN